MSRLPDQNQSACRIARRIFAGICLAGFFVLLYLVLTGQSSGFDDPVRNSFYLIRSDELTPVLIVVTNLADTWFIIGVCLVLLILPWTRLKFGVPLSAGSLAITMLNKMIKELVERARPDVLHLVEEQGFSFPSGHSITSIFFYGLSIWLFWHYVKDPRICIIATILLGIPMILVGMTRVYHGVHYPTDVLAGWCLGLFSIIVVIEIIEALEQRRAVSASERPDD